MKARELRISDPVFWTLLTALVLVALAIRLYRLGDLPDGLYCDEAATGYDAFCLLKTGMALHPSGTFFFFSHYGVDFVESLYTYLSTPFVYLFGLSVQSTRMLAACAGTATVLTTCLLARELYGKPAALLAAFIVTFSPWHLAFSRIAFRGILLPLFVTLGVLFFLRGLQRTRGLVLSGLAFGLAFHTYSVSKLFVPLLFFLLIYMHRASLNALVRSSRAAHFHSICGILILITLAIPVYSFSFFGSGNNRFFDISILGDPSPVISFLRNYLLHLTPGFLFTDGDPNLRHSIPGYGQLLGVFLPFVVIGVIVAFRVRTTSHLLPIAVFLLGIVPPAMTNESLPHALRAIGAFPFLEITAAAGIATVLRFVWVSDAVTKWSITAATALILSYSATGFTHAYFKNYPQVSQAVFQHGMEELVRICESEKNNYDFVVIPATIRQAYIFVLFYGNRDPAAFQSARDLGKYLVDVRKISKPGKYLIVVDSVGGLLGHRPKHWIRAPGNEPVLGMFEYTVPE